MTTDHTERDAAISELQSLVSTTQYYIGPNAGPGGAPPPAEPEPPEPEPTGGKGMNRDKPELPAYMIALIGLIIIGVLTFHGDAVPDILNLAVIGSLGIGGAVTTPKTGGGE